MIQLVNFNYSFDWSIRAMPLASTITGQCILVNLSLLITLKLYVSWLFSNVCPFFCEDNISSLKKIYYRLELDLRSCIPRQFDLRAICRQFITAAAAGAAGVIVVLPVM
jgi:hypothetical protein